MYDYVIMSKVIEVIDPEESSYIGTCITKYSVPIAVAKTLDLAKDWLKNNADRYIKKVEPEGNWYRIDGNDEFSLYETGMVKNYDGTDIKRELSIRRVHDVID